MGFHSLFTTGNIVNKDFAFYDLPFNLDPFDQNEFKKSHIDFYLTATNIENGKAEYFKIENVFKENGILQSNLCDAFRLKICGN